MEDLSTQHIGYECLTDRLLRLKSMNGQKFKTSQISEVHILNSPRFTQPSKYGKYSGTMVTQACQQDKQYLTRNSSNFNHKIPLNESIKFHRHNVSNNEKDNKSKKMFELKSNNSLMSIFSSINMNSNVKREQWKGSLISNINGKRVAGKIYKNIIKA